LQRYRRAAAGKLSPYELEGHGYLLNMLRPVSIGIGVAELLFGSSLMSLLS